MAEPVRKTVTPVRDEAPDTPRPQPVTPVAPTEARSKTRAAVADERRRPRRRNRVRWTLFALLPIALVVGGYFDLTGGQVMSTDDAYVQAEKVWNTTDVSGIVQDVAVKDNQHVAAEQVLYRLDPRQFQIALDNAKANLGANRVVDRGDEAGLQAHGERHRCAAGPGRPRSGQLRSQCHAAAQCHHFPGRLRSGALHARQRQKQARSLARAGAGAACQARRQSGAGRHRTSAIPSGSGTGRRGATPARSHGHRGAVRRGSDRRALHRAGEVSCGIDDGVLSRRYRSYLGRCQRRRRPS